MALLIADRVQETSTTTGTGPFTLAGAKTGFRTFGSVLATNDTTYYTIVQADVGAWEVGLGTYTGPNTLARTTVLASSNANTAVNFGAGAKDVFISAAAAILPPKPIRLFRTTLSTSAGTPATVTHSLALSNKDDFVIRVADSTGADVGVRVTSVDVNSLQITTAVAASNLAVTVVGT